MKKSIMPVIITIIVALFVFYMGLTNKGVENLDTKYKVYLDGNEIGLINDTNNLYSLINEEQSTIKSKYNVDQVYPPKGFEIEKYVSYNDNISSANDIYDKIKNSKSFTLKGYVITVSSPATEKEDAKILFKVNVLDKKVFDDSIKDIISTFIPYDKFEAYMKDEQQEIKDTGSIIENVYFKENITIKEAYISTEEKIFTKSDDLTRYLMFGDENANKDYTVKKGDTIASIADENQLNTSEFLIANPKFTSATNMLAIGEKVNVALINPKLSLVYDTYIVEDTEVKYDTETKYDNSKSSSYKKVEQQGRNGIQRVAKRTQVVNGEASQGAVIDKENTYMIRDVVNEIVVKGNKSYNYGSANIGTYYDDGSNWAWPTNVPYTLSSPFGWRWGSMHVGQDITGTGYGSPIYSIGSGIVRSAGWGGMVGNAAGNNVVIEHPNGYWSVYAHLSDVNVSVGQNVSRKEKIGSMGRTGAATGVHLHLSVSIGQPYNGGKWIDPMKLLK